tara:strand:+ start:24303 stop:24821 length:519 start_codon:yes stop_codon:yes gene_type:complete
MNRHVFLISTVAMLSCYSAVSVAQFAYRCTDQNGHVTLQGDVCPEQSYQHKMPMPTFGPSSSDSLRPYELTSLDRLHEDYILRKSYEYENRNTMAFERVRHENIVDYENLKQKHAIEMFDKNYQHYWVNGYSIGEAPLSMGYGAYNSTTTNSAGNTNSVGNTTTSAINNPVP